jgi:hypothetical protein
MSGTRGRRAGAYIRRVHYRDVQPDAPEHRPVDITPAPDRTLEDLVADLAADPELGIWRREERAADLGYLTLRART